MYYNYVVKKGFYTLLYITIFEQESAYDKVACAFGRLAGAGVSFRTENAYGPR